MGTRKLKVFIITLVAILFVFFFAIYRGVLFSGQEITNIILVIATLSGAFFGANFGEHWAMAKKSQNSNGN